MPAGSSYGDAIAAGPIVAGQIRHHLIDELIRFRESGKLILGICNGFQILLKSGILLPDEANQAAPATLTWNDSGRFEDRWVHVKTDSEKCVFLRGIERMYLPIAHAEGRFVMRSVSGLQVLASHGQLALRYTRDTGKLSATDDTPLPFPENPNGSQANVAGVCDASGRVFGLMPHPERHIHPTQHPHWTRLAKREIGDGMQLFRNAVEYFV